MPLLDPGIVVSSAYLSDDIQIRQRTLTVGNNGRATHSDVTADSFAIVTVAGPNDLEVLPEAERAGRINSFITNAQVRPVGPNNLPDVILWPVVGGVGQAQWKVINVGPYPNYGRGWYQVLAASQDPADVPL